MAVNANTLKAAKKRRAYLQQAKDLGAGIVCVQESRDRKANGIRVRGTYICIASPADEKGNYGTEIRINCELGDCTEKGNGIHIVEDDVKAIVYD